MDQKTIQGLKLLAELIDFSQAPEWKRLAAKAKALKAEVLSGLPRKIDGTTWTDADITAKAAEARKPFEDVLNRTSDGPSGQA